MTLSKEDVEIVEINQGDSYSIQVILDGRKYNLQEETDLKSMVSIRDDLITREGL